MRIPLAAWILICLLAVSPRALAAPDPSALAFCRVLQNDREELPRVDRWTRFQDILKLTLAPGRRVGLQEERGVNVIELRSLGAHERARAAHLEFQIALQIPGSIETPKIQHYFLRDGAYQGSKAEFNRISH